MSLLERADRALKRAGLREITYDDLSETIPDADLPWLDRADVDEAALTEAQRQWRAEGYLELPGLLPDELVDPYVAVRAAEGEWPGPCAYLHVREIRDLCLFPPLMETLRELMGAEMGMHLNLTGWKSTERDWHQDDYLNPSFVNAHYLAVWIALEDIHPDCGVFEYVPGSHRWPSLRGERVRAFMAPEEAASERWPKLSESLVVPVVERRLAKSGLPVKRFLARKGDVLVWHGKLVHRGSRPIDPSRERRAIITHYSAIDHRPDMPDLRRHGSAQGEGGEDGEGDGGCYFVPPGFTDELAAR